VSYRLDTDIVSAPRRPARHPKVVARIGARVPDTLHLSAISLGPLRAEGCSADGSDGPGSENSGAWSPPGMSWTVWTAARRILDCRASGEN